MRPSFRFLAAVTGSAVALSATALDAQTERKTLTGSSVAIYDIAGHIAVESGTGNDVVVEITRRGSDASKLKLEMHEIRGANALVVRYPDDDIVYPEGRWRGNTTMTLNDDGSWGDNRGWNGHRVRVRSSGSGTEAWADIRVLVPTGKRVDVHLGVGELGASGVNGALRLETAAGRIVTSNTKGDLNVDAGSGSVEVREMSGGDLRVDTGSGGSTLSGVAARVCTVDAGSGGITGDTVSCDEIKMDAGSGGVRLERAKAGIVKLDAGSGSVKLGLLTLPREIKVDAGSGGVTVSIPANSGATIDIETGSGGVESDFPVTTTRMERNHLRGTIGDGSARIRIESGSGSVRLLKN